MVYEVLIYSLPNVIQLHFNMNGFSCAELFDKDKKLMSTSFAVATVLLRVYHEAHRKNEEQKP